MDASDSNSNRREEDPLPSSSKEYHALGATTTRDAAAADRQWAIQLFSLTTILLFADQNLMSPNLTAMAEEYGFDDEERDTKLGGHIALAFWVLGAPAALGVGVLADQFNRSRLFAWTVFIGEGACALTFFTTTYTGLYICRALTGFSIGGALPLIYSILGDMFKADERHKVNAMVGMGTGVGISLGQGVAGFLGPTFGWRLPFLVVSIPALICAAAVLWTVQDPERGGMEQVVLERRKATTGDNPSTEQQQQQQQQQTDATTKKEVELQELKHNSTQQQQHQVKETIVPAPESGVRRRSFPRDNKQQEAENESLLLNDEKQQIPPNSHSSSIAMRLKSKPIVALLWRHVEPALQSLRLLCQTPTVVFALLQGVPGCLPWGIVNTYLNDFLAEDRGMSVEFATFTILWFGVGNFFGLVIGGAGGQYLYLVDKRYPALLAGSMAIFGCAPFWVLLNGVNNNSNFLFIASVALIAGTAAGITGPIIKATLQNVTLPHMRGQAFALYNTADDFGRGLGPVFVAYLITSVGGRTPAFNLGTLGWVACGVFNLLIFFTAARDEEKAQASLSATWDQRQPQQSA